MKNKFSLEINKPCSENFNQFTPTKLGGFCASCEKDVVDFTKMTSLEVINYFKIYNTKNTCGQFNRKQLTNYTEKSIRRKKYNYLSTLGIAFLSLFTFNTVHAQKINSSNEKNTTKVKTQQGNIVVKGNISDEAGPLPGVSILLQGTNTGIESDFNGNFTFPKNLKVGDTLLFSFIGMESQKVIIQNNSSASNIELKVNMELDACMLLGKVAVKKIYSSKKK